MYCLCFSKHSYKHVCPSYDTLSESGNFDSAEVSFAELGSPYYKKASWIANEVTVFSRESGIFNASLFWLPISVIELWAVVLNKQKKFYTETISSSGF